MSNIPKFCKGMSYADTLGPALEITDQWLADLYFDALVQFTMKEWSKTQEECEVTVRQNLAYYAGYYDAETRKRVERLYRCAHPVFGSITANGIPASGEALKMGWDMMAEQMKNEEVNPKGERV